MANQKTIHILLVEDDPGDTRLIRELFTEVSSIRFIWENVERLSAAKDILRAEYFDLVLLDLSLPDSHGLDTFIQLHPHAICLPVVVVTGPDDELLAIEAVKAGAQDYLIKGQIENKQLVRALRSAIERKRTETALRARNQQLTEINEHLWQKAGLVSSMDQLVSSLVRELNNPLAVVSVQLEDLLAQFHPNDPKSATLHAVHTEVERMGRRVASLLQASMQNAQHEQEGTSDVVQYLGRQPDSILQNYETHFLEALGTWLTGYLFRGTFVPPRLLDSYLKQMKKSGTTVSESLAPREREVVSLVAKGYTNKEIAKRLSLSVRTVERQCSSVMNKLGLQNRAELIAYAVQHGLLRSGDTE